MSGHAAADHDVPRPERSAIVAPPGPGSVMAIAAHPDDIESWCAGTLALASDAGAKVRLLLVTSGDKGSVDSADTVLATLAVRRDSWQS